MSEPQKRTEETVMCWDCGDTTEKATATSRKLDGGEIVYECPVCYDKSSPANPELFGIGVADAP